jgi:hypothetical protein
MTKSKLTNQTRTSKQSSERKSKIDTFLIHHQASTNDDATIREMVTGSKEVSANYTISNEGRLTSVVPEERRAWTSGSTSDGGKGADWDHRSVTVEIENKTGDPNWEISDKALDKAAALLHDLKKRYDIEHVLGHRDLWNKYKASYPTFCPGPETVAEIIKREKAIPDTPVKKPPVKPTPKPDNKPTPKPDNKPTPKPEPKPDTKDWEFKLPSKATQVRIQRALGRRGRYTGPLDGKMQTESLKGVQKTLAVGVGYEGPIDGKIEELGCELIQKYAKKFGSYSGPVDKKLGEQSWIGFALGLERG